MAKITPDNEDYLFKRVIKFVSYRSRSRYEVCEYLKKISQNQNLIDKVTLRLIELSLIDDNQFAKDFTSSQIKKFKGKTRIRFSLQQKGISDDIIHSTLNEIKFNDWFNAAIKYIYKKKYEKMQFNYQTIFKLKQSLFNRGFDSKIINAVIDEISDNRVE